MAYTPHPLGEENYPNGMNVCDRRDDTCAQIKALYHQDKFDELDTVYQVYINDIHRCNLLDLEWYFSHGTTTMDDAFIAYMVNMYNTVVLQIWHRIIVKANKSTNICTPIPIFHCNEYRPNFITDKYKHEDYVLK
jgi:hypothetical protein